MEYVVAVCVDVSRVEVVQGRLGVPVGLLWSVGRAGAARCCPGMQDGCPYWAHGCTYPQWQQHKQG